MHTRRWMVNGFVAASVAVVGVVAAAGCGPSGTQAPTGTRPGAPAGSQPPAAPVGPREALLSSVALLTTMSYKTKANLSGGVTVAEAVVDPVGKAATSKTTSTAPGDESAVVEQITVSGEVFVKAALRYRNAPKIPVGWMTLDLARVTDPGAFNLVDPDPARLASELFKGLGTVERSSERGFSGTLDLVKGKKAGIVNERTVDRLMERATAIPFEATVDDQGRIATFKIVIAAVPTAHLAAQTWQVSYLDWGTAVSIAKPPGAVPAPQAFYDEYVNV